jgi:hypothetical protein
MGWVVGFAQTLELLPQGFCDVGADERMVLGQYPTIEMWTFHSPASEVFSNRYLHLTGHDFFVGRIPHRVAI